MKERPPKPPEPNKKEDLEKKIKDAVRKDPCLCDPHCTKHNKLVGC